MVLSTLRVALAKRPLLKSVVTVTSLITAADVSCQLIEYKGAHFDWLRLRNMMSIGVCYYGPFYYYYYGMLDRKLPGKNPRTIALKLLIDQVTLLTWNFSFSRWQGVTQGSMGQIKFQDS